MGGSQSQDQQERVITVEERAGPDGDPQITVTQEFLKYLYEAKSGSRDPQSQEEEEEEEVPYISAEEVLTGEPEYPPGRQSEESAQWKLKYEQERKKNEDLKNLSSKEFSTVVTKVREKFEKTPLHNLLPVCDDCKDEVLDCYHSNPGKTLNCSGEVKKYIECIERARKGLLHVSSKS